MTVEIRPATTGLFDDADTERGTPSSAKWSRDPTSACALEGKGSFAKVDVTGSKAGVPSVW